MLGFRVAFFDEDDVFIYSDSGEYVAIPRVEEIVRITPHSGFPNNHRDLRVSKVIHVPQDAKCPVRVYLEGW